MDPEIQTTGRANLRYNQNMKKNYTANFKAQVVLDILKEEKTITEIASEYGVHPTQLETNGRRKQ